MILYYILFSFKTNILILQKIMKEFSKISELDKEDYYYSDEGYIVFTEKYHLKRGYCCDNNCKHCPFKKNKKKMNEKS